ncbi:hypothetical protein BC827DRAFT_37634 [Russula dissimulans]|nr:hypothetical protein BC827DRAFT_37634 [Russula dissimulans]
MVPFTKKPSRGPSLTRPATADPAANGQRRYRGSILGAASDALRFGRRRRSIKEPPPPPQPRLLLPEVIEVRASALTPTFDEEEEAEREQLRAAAVQSVGFDVDISRPPDRQHSVFGDHQQRDTNEREDCLHEKECENGHASPPLSPISLPSAADCSISDASRSTQIARIRGHMSSPAPIRVAQPTSTSATAAPGEVPAFPSTRAQVAVHEQLSATLPKHYPPPSLLMLALSKQWKARHVVLSAPVLAGASYLHVFKSSAADERELERLEINERSVVFVNDEDVGGRRGVVRVGGVDVGARRELNGKDNGMTIMMLQILDSNQSQNWINAIKNAVLGQRSVRAGLGIPSDSSGAVEPRGDLDVMLSMRKQGILSSPVKPSFTSPDDTIKLRKPGSSEEMSVTPQPPSIRSRPVSPRAPNGVLSLKSLFSVSGSGSSRPRSSSSARPVSPDAGPGEFHGSAASSLLNMRARADSPIVKPYSMLPPTGPALDPAVQLQRKIIDTQSTLDWAPLENSKSPPRPMSPSLNPPPPRRRAYTTNEPRQLPSSPDSGRLLYNHGNTSTAGSFGIPVPEATRPPLERASSERAKPRTSSVSSTATTESGSARRWSRQSNASPRPTPPDDDDSSTPISTVPQPSPWQNSALPSTEFDPSPSRSSLQSQKTLPSFISGLHGASKRASTSSSVQSIATTSSNHQHMGTFSIARSKASGHRMSVPPPPRPAPSTALPPTPTGSDTENPVIPPTTTVKAIRRNSLARRALRLSLGQPALPVQPHAYAQGLLHDGANTAPTSRSHSRSTSVDSMPRSALSHVHVIPQALLEPPSPPPTRPLPPPPSVASASTRAPLPPIPRTSSFKQRLRILSAPSGRSTPRPPQ